MFGVPRRGLCKSISSLVMVRLFRRFLISVARLELFVSAVESKFGITLGVDSVSSLVSEIESCFVILLSFVFVERTWSCVVMSSRICASVSVSSACSWLALMVPPPLTLDRPLGDTDLVLVESSFLLENDKGRKRVWLPDDDNRVDPIASDSSLACDFGSTSPRCEAGPDPWHSIQ